jgi:hypothetical protein
MTNSLVLRAASDNLTLYEQYASDRGIVDHNHAMECLDCEACLQLGIDAFRWLVEADEVISCAVAKDIIEYDEKVEAEILALFRRWLAPCEFANRWIDVQVKRGYQPDNLSEFRRCEAEVNAIVSSQDNTDRQMSDELIRMRDEALEEHRRGETSEFV